MAHLRKIWTELHWLNCRSSCVTDMWARPLLGPYVSDPMHLQLSNSCVGIFVGVDYGGAKGWKYCWSQRIGRAWGEESHACRFFHTGWSGGTAGGRRRVWQAYLFPHMERKKFGDERASCRYGERCIISHLACRARYSLKSLKTYMPHTCSYFKVH